MRGRYAIDCPLEDRDKVFFGIRMRYPGRGSGGDRGGWGTGCGLESVIHPSHALGK